MQPVSDPKRNVIKVKYNRTIRRFPYPQKLISEFIQDLRLDFRISPKATVQLLDGQEELSSSSTLADLGIEKMSELTLLELVDNNHVTIKL